MLPRCHPRACLGSLLVVVAAVAACGGESAGDDAPDARPLPRPVDAGVDAMPIQVVSSPPDLTWVAMPGSRLDIAFVSSNLVEESQDSGVVQHWYAEVKNTGTTTLCEPRIVINFFDASGQRVAVFEDAADAALYEGSIAARTCIAPGAVGVFAGTRDGDIAIPVADARRAAYSIQAMEIPGAQPHPRAPRVVSARAAPGWREGSWKVVGRLDTPGGAQFVTVSVYPIGADGLIVDDLSAIRAGGSGAFETSDEHRGPRFDRMHVFTSFVP